MKHTASWVVVGALLLAAVISWFWKPGEGPNGLRRVEDKPDGGLSMLPPQIALNALRDRAARADAGVALGPAHPLPPNVVAKFGWGAGEDQLGRARPESGNPEGPMSLAAGPGGTVVVLDQVNERLLKLDSKGKVLSSTPLPVRGAQDVTVAPDGTSLVLDRLLDKQVAVMNPDGKLVGTLNVEGQGVDDSGGVTGVFADGKDVYVEREHADQVKIGSTDGTQAEHRDEVPGRLSKDGTLYLTAGISEPGGNRVYLMAIEKSTRQPRFSREYTMQNPVFALDLLDTDRVGIIYLGAVAAPEGQGATITLMCLDPLDGRPLGVTTFPANDSPEETFRELTVPEEGGVYYLYRTEQGAELRHYDCR